MTAPTTHWSTTGQLHTGTVEGCEACEGVGTGAGEGATGQDTGTAWVTRSADCPEAPAQAHPLAEPDAAAEQRYRAMVGADLPREVRAERAHANREKLRESDSLPPRSDAGPKSVSLSHRDGDNGAEAGL